MEKLYVTATNEQRQAILTAFYARHPEMRTAASYRAYLLTRYPALPATDADLPHTLTTTPALVGTTGATT